MAQAAETPAAPSGVTEQSIADVRAQFMGKTIDEALSATPEPAGDRAPASDTPTEKPQENGDTKPNETPNPAKSNRDDKSTERATKTWEEINSEKNRLAEERARFEREKQEFEVKATAVRDAAKKAEASAEELESYAKEWEQEGRDDLAKEARLRAANIRAEAKVIEQRSKEAAFKAAQNKVIGELVKENPDLSKEDSELSKNLNKLLQAKPALLSYPDGIRDAVQFLKSQTAVTKVAALEKEVAELKQQLAAKEKLLQPSGGGSSAPASGQRIENMPVDDAIKVLREQVRAAADRGESPI